MDLPWHDDPVSPRDPRNEPPGPRHLAAVVLAPLAVSLVAWVASWCTGSAIPTLSIVQAGAIVFVLVFGAFVADACGRGHLGDGYLLAGMTFSTWVAALSVMVLDRRLFRGSSLDGYFGDVSDLLVFLVFSGVAWFAWLSATEGSSRRTWRAAPWIARALALVGALLVVLATARGLRLPAPTEYHRAQPVIGTDKDPKLERVIRACSYRVRAGPIEVRYDRIHALYTIWPRVGWVTACARNPAGDYERVSRKVYALHRALSAPREWVAFAALGLVLCACVRRDRTARSVLAVRAQWQSGTRHANGQIEATDGTIVADDGLNGEVGPVVILGERAPIGAVYRTSPHHAEIVTLDGTPAEVEARLWRRLWARDAWRIAVLLVTLSPLVVALCAGLVAP
jgi:hypothetical protein